MKLKGQQTLMRIFIGESDQWKMKPLYEALVELLRDEGLAGATVFKGVMGFGFHSVINTDKLLRFSADLPVVLEVVDTAEKIQAVMPLIDSMMDGGMITLQTIQVTRYRQENCSC